MEFCGMYRLERDENFEDILKELDVPYLVRKMVKSLAPVMVIRKDEESDMITIDCEHLRLFNYSISFKLDEEFDEHVFTGENVRVLVQQETDHKWVQEQLTGKHKGLLVIREMLAQDLCKVTMHYNEKTCNRYFRRI